ncbi:ATP-binding cassette domain-containing protein [Solicola sp. PLA-1-18]|uniref:ATP-binding cassette domain-containing protein n=1 Tax=Solicola sp. PLA-1-18 TaxID=3380532 RepID=UPI003B815CDE
MSAPVLQARGLTKSYGGVVALDGVDLDVADGQSVGVIGPNGAGKSTFVGVVSGALAATSGTLHLDGTDATGLSAPARTGLGIGRTHQIPRPFGRMTVLENLLLAGRHAPGRESMAATRQRSLNILDRTGLGDVAHSTAGGLPLLRRKRLELARALALKPRVLLLDEIGAGLVEHEIAELIDLVNDVRGEVAGIVLIEHVMDVIKACCERTVVLDFGKKIAEGTTAEVLADPQVAEVYLGTAAQTGTTPATVHDRLPTDREVVLDVRGAAVSYGGVRALRGVDLDVRRGEVVTLLGANGAGKTTLARAISAAVPLDAGTITFQGGRIDGTSPDRVADAGIAHCMEGRRIFSVLTVQENLILAADRVPRAEQTRRLRHVFDVFPVLADQRNKRGTAMSGGQQQMLAIGRALMAEPTLLILDEVSLGLSPVAVDGVYDTLGTIRQTGVAMLLVEQNLQRGLALADRGVVIAHGSVALTGTPAELAAHPSLASLYVGDDSASQTA